jgi:protein-tyrosine phosphatase
MKPNLFPIPLPGPGRLSTMTRPRGGDWLADAMSELREAGVDVLVCLITSAELDELDLADEGVEAERAGLRFRHLPIVDMGVPDYDRAAPVIDELVTCLDDGDHVVVHCRAGIGRSSLIAAALLTRLGVPEEQAWLTIGTARGVTVPEHEEQGQWLHRYFGQV